MEPLVSAVNGVWHWTRGPGFRARTVSPPGLTIHGMESGSYELTLLGSVRPVRAGDLVFYGPGEDHAWKGDLSVTSFYSINVQPAVALLPSSQQRVVASDGAVLADFRAAHEAFQSGDDPSARARCFSAVYRVLASALTLTTPEAEPGEALLWRQLETTVVAKRWFRMPVAELARFSGYSESTVYRSCRLLHGVSPLVRLRQVRLDEARNLLRHTPLTVQAIAAELGYPRIHEFSREFRKEEGQPPVAFRRRTNSGGRSPAT